MCVIDDCVGQRVIRLLLRCSSHAQQIVFRVTCKRMNRSEYRPSHSQGSGLVQNNRIEMRQALKRFSALEEHAELCAASHGNCEPVDVRRSRHKAGEKSRGARPP